PEIPLDKQRPAEYVFQKNVTQKLSEMRAAEAAEKARKSVDAA
ncbi:MAG: hopanoid biosynthesis associated radical SAM protein HpnH, partial [Hyphomicrobiales bacterium]|nr:hopanoid biosynthesis associated radical SAM protein HpnH [Hyphomicrobiales bacterium]MBV8664143.1 hopanoid biosynthesis associated radical SAM protein HpnH [Hyphomicrobiales bacterium]